MPTYRKMDLPAEVATLIRDFVPVHPAAKLIQALPQAGFEALRTRYVKPCPCIDKQSAVSRLTRMRCALRSEDCRSWRYKVCICELFNDVHRAAREKEDPEFYDAMSRLFEFLMWLGTNLGVR